MQSSVFGNNRICLIFKEENDVSRNIRSIHKYIEGPFAEVYEFFLGGFGIISAWLHFRKYKKRFRVSASGFLFPEIF